MKLHIREVEITRSEAQDIIDTASDYIGYWCGGIRKGVLGWFITVDCEGDTGQYGTTSTHLAEAMAKLLDGRVGMRSDMVQELHREVLDCASDPTFGFGAGADVCDCIVQVAIFGEIRYG